MKDLFIIAILVLALVPATFAEDALRNATNSMIDRVPLPVEDGTGPMLISTNTATVTVNQIPAITTQPVITQNICVGGTIATPLTINFAGGAGAITYQWYLNTVNSNVGGSLILGATSLNYTPPVFTSSGTNYYYLAHN